MSLGVTITKGSSPTQSDIKKVKNTAFCLTNKLDRT